MCGIVGVVASEQTWDGTGDIQTLVVPSLDEALRRLQTTVSDADLVACLEAAAKEVGAVQGLLAGPRGVVCVAHAAEMLPIYQSKLDEIWGRIEAFEADLDEHGAIDVDIERVNAALEKLKDLTWRVRSDHLRIAAGAIYLAGADASPHTTGLFSMISIALSAIDRIEVRGRDSAGIAVVVRDHGLDLSSPEIRSMIEARSADPLLPSMSVREGGGNLCFVYKAAAEVGELGDNTRKIRAEIWSDHFIHRVLASPDARVIVLGHTRWASVGMISEPNAHPLASDEGPVTLAVLNGDIDNHADIRAAEGFEFPREITTDTKIIPALMSRRITDGLDVAEAFRRTVSVFEGSTAIGAISLLQPDRLFLALRGSGQALYVGLSDLGYVVASEPYGSVEQASAYVRMEGEGDTRGQIVVVTEPTHGGTDGLIRRSYDGTELPIGDGDVKGAEITTRDVDRGPYPHFLLKELLSSPRSFRKTLRGRLVGAGDEARVVLGEEALPRELIDKLTSGAITRITVIGQGSAAIAGRAVGVTLAAALDPSPVDVAAMAAPELSGFG
ncbi:MAG: glucosamine-6-phosphate synthase, partial [Actinomycetota bacterium]